MIFIWFVFCHYEKRKFWSRIDCDENEKKKNSLSDYAKVKKRWIWLNNKLGSSKTYMKNKKIEKYLLKISERKTNKKIVL